MANLDGRIKVDRATGHSEFGDFRARHPRARNWGAEKRRPLVAVATGLELGLDGKYAKHVDDEALPDAGMGFVVEDLWLAVD